MIHKTNSKAELHKKKCYDISVWWDYKAVVYFKLLPRTQTTNSDVYYQQLMKLDKDIKKNGQNWQQNCVSS